MFAALPHFCLQNALGLLLGSSWAPFLPFGVTLGILWGALLAPEKSKKPSRDALGALSVHFLALLSAFGGSGGALGSFLVDFRSILEPPGPDSGQF